MRCQPRRNDAHPKSINRLTCEKDTHTERKHVHEGNGDTAIHQSNEGGFGGRCRKLTVEEENGDLHKAGADNVDFLCSEEDLDFE